jgi:thiamine biosynthesis lipoprotein
VTIRRAKPLLGTLVEIQVEAVNAAAAHRAIDAAFAEIAVVHRLMSFHASGSDIDRLNRAGEGAEVEVDLRTAEVLACADALHRESGGAFDVGVAAVLVEQGQLPRPQGSDSPSDAIPSGERCTVRRGEQMIDLGGIAKGYAVDRAIEVLVGSGVASALVNAGGDLRHHGAAPVEIALRDPADASRIVAAISLAGMALASSSTRSLASEQGLASPAAVLIDSRDPLNRTTLRPGAGVSVVAPCCMLADVLTKVVLVSGRDDHPMLASHGAGVVAYRAVGAMPA